MTFLIKIKLRAQLVQDDVQSCELSCTLTWKYPVEGKKYFAIFGRIRSKVSIYLNEWFIFPATTNLLVKFSISIYPFFVKNNARKAFFYTLDNVFSKISNFTLERYRFGLNPYSHSTRNFPRLRCVHTQKLFVLLSDSYFAWETSRLKAIRDFGLMLQR